MKTLDLPADLEHDLADLAARTGKPEDELILDALRAFLDRSQRPSWWPRSVGMMGDLGIAAADSEDWLLANWRPEEDWGLEMEEDRESGANRDPT